MTSTAGGEHPAAQILEELTRLEGRDAHLRADGEIRIRIDGDPVLAGMLTPEEARKVLEGTPTGESVATHQGERYRILNDQKTMLARHLPKHVPTLETVTGGGGAGATLSAPPVVGSGRSTTTRGFLVYAQSLREGLTEAASEAAARGDHATAAELDQADALLRDVTEELGKRYR